MKEGQGSIKFPDNSKYEGYFQADLPEGHGLYENNFMRYEGSFSKGMFSGRGKLVYKIGDSFEGIFENSEIREGKLSYVNGDEY